MLAKDVRALLEAYREIYSDNGSNQELIHEEVDNVIKEVIEELIEEVIELGYSLDEAACVVEEATIEYLAELNPYAPAGSKESRAYNKATTSTKRGEARKAAVKATVNNVRQRAAGAAVSAYAAGRVAKDAVGSAADTVGRGAQRAAADAKKRIRGGIKKALGGGLRAVANRAGKAASRLGEESVLEAKAVGKARSTDQNPKGATVRVSSGRGMTMTRAGGLGKNKTFKNNPDGDDMVKSQYDDQVKADRRAAAKDRAASGEDRVSNLIRSVQNNSYEPDDIYDLVIEYLLNTGHAETISEAHYIMLEMDKEFIETIVEGSGIVTGTAKVINTALKPANQTPAQGKAAVGNITRSLDVVAKPIKSALSPANNSSKAQQQRIDKYRP